MAHEGHDHHHHDHDDHHHHHHHDHTEVSVWVMTCSDTRSTETDEGGKLAREKLQHAGHSLAGTSLVRDEADAIRTALQSAKQAGARAVVITGGTGLSSRDVTIDTVAPMFQRTIDGFGELFRSLSFQQVGSAAMASRAIAGVWDGVLIFAVPGAPKGVALALDRLILPELGHLVREIAR